jgi:hypothetical protein
MHVILGDRLRKWSAQGLLEVQIVRAANHTFTLLWSQEQLLTLVRDWMSEMAQDRRPAHMPGE